MFRIKLPRLVPDESETEIVTVPLRSFIKNLPLLFPVTESDTATRVDDAMLATFKMGEEML